MTDEQAAQLAALYNQLFIKVKLGDIVNCSLSGSHSNNNYQMQVCYLISTKICLLGFNNLGNAYQTDSRNYNWTVTFAAGTLTNNSITKYNIKIPTLENITTTTANFARDFVYWTNTINSSSGKPYRIINDGIDAQVTASFGYGTIPYVIIDL